MKRIFQIWLSIFVTIAFITTIALSWSLQTSVIRKNAYKLLSVNIEDAKLRLEKSNENLEYVLKQTEDYLRSVVRGWEKTIEIDPTIVGDQARMQDFADTFGVKELHVSDENGILIASIPQSLVGFDMNSTDQSAEFMPALTDKNFEYIQKPRPNGAYGKLIQYGGIARQDKPGIVQVGIIPSYVGRAATLADRSNISSSFIIGHKGELHIYKRIAGKLYGFNENGEYFREEDVDEVKSLVLSKVYGDYVITASIPKDEVFIERASVLRFLSIGNFILFIVVFLLVSYLLQRIVISGIYQVNDSLHKITDGKLDERVEVSTTPEFIVLSDGVNSTVSALEKAIEKEAKRIDDELRLCRAIQRSFLPTDFPHESSFSLAGDLYTAKEVGGDFYDFFYLDPQRFVFEIADVSGKGITAALFMTSAKTLLRKTIQSGVPLAKAIETANAELTRGNSTHMFLTAFFCVLNVETGELTCVDAGHNPPLLRRADGTWQYLDTTPSIILGVMENASYESVDYRLEQGDSIFLYTDGVSEAMNMTHETFGEERLKNCLDKICGEEDVSPDDVVKRMKEEVENYREGAPQSDDVTMLTLKYFGGGKETR